MSEKEILECLEDRMVKEYNKTLVNPMRISFFKHILPLIATLILVTTAAGTVILYMARAEDRDTEKDIESIQTRQQLFQDNLKEDVKEIKEDIKELKSDVRILTSNVNKNMLPEPEFTRKIRMEAREVSREECKCYCNEYLNIINNKRSN